MWCVFRNKIVHSDLEIHIQSCLCDFMFQIDRIWNIFCIAICEVCLKSTHDLDIPNIPSNISILHLTAGWGAFILLLTIHSWILWYGWSNWNSQNQFTFICNRCLLTKSGVIKQPLQKMCIYWVYYQSDWPRNSRSNGQNEYELTPAVN